jgi:hypothetical protein
MHRYNNQDHSMLTAMVAVDNIARGSADKENVWAGTPNRSITKKNSENTRLMRVGIDARNPAHGVVVVELLQHRQRQVESFDPMAPIIEGVIVREAPVEPILSLPILAVVSLCRVSES